MSAVILIIDGDKESRESLEDVLREEEYRVHSAAAGQEALEVFKEKEIDLMILELKLPDMSGVEVMRQVGLSYPQT